jgi:formylglycine-generating enzyme required for sulfatase activity
MLNKILTFFFLSISITLSATSTKEFVVTIPQEQWDEIGSPDIYASDVCIMRTGTEVYGDVAGIPELDTVIGSLSFNIDELAALVVKIEEGKVQYITRFGDSFTADIPTEPIMFHRFDDSSQASIDLLSINTILFRQRHQRPWITRGEKPKLNIVFNNGDRLPLHILDSEINVSHRDGPFTVKPEHIVDVSFSRETLEGILSGTTENRSLKPCQIVDEILSVSSKKEGRRVQIFWYEISRITKDQDPLTFSTPFLFSPDLTSQMVYIPPGRFMMGEKKDRFVPSKQDSSRVIEMPAFYVDRYEVTNTLYKLFVDATGHTAPSHWLDGEIPSGLHYHPVVNVTYLDAESFARWAGKRLPTEEEWERAAKGGAGSSFPYGESYRPDLANTESQGTQTVGSYKRVIDATNPSPLSLAMDIFDMSGNVAEWTASNASGEKTKTYGSPYSPYQSNGRQGSFKSVRGGSFESSEATATTTFESMMHVDDCNIRTGFRCVMDE